MLLTIHNLPIRTQYNEVKSLITSCGINEVIIDKLENESNGLRVTIGVNDDQDAAIIFRKIHGLYFKGQQLYVQNKKQTWESQQSYQTSAKHPNIDYNRQQNMYDQPANYANTNYQTTDRESDQSYHTSAEHQDQYMQQPQPNIDYNGQPQKMYQQPPNYANINYQTTDQTNQNAYSGYGGAQSQSQQVKVLDVYQQALRYFDTGAAGRGGNPWDERSDLPDSTGGYGRSQDTYESRPRQNDEDGRREPRQDSGPSSRGGYVSRGGHAPRDGRSPRGGHAARDWHSSRGGHAPRDGHSSRGDHAPRDRHSSRGGHAARGGRAPRDGQSSRGGHGSRGSYTPRGGPAPRGDHTNRGRESRPEPDSNHGFRGNHETNERGSFGDAGPSPNVAWGGFDSDESYSRGGGQPNDFAPRGGREANERGSRGHAFGGHDAARDQRPTNSGSYKRRWEEPAGDRRPPAGDWSEPAGTQRPSRPRHRDRPDAAAAAPPPKKHRDFAAPIAPPPKKQRDFAAPNVMPPNERREFAARNDSPADRKALSKLYTANVVKSVGMLMFEIGTALDILPLFAAGPSPLKKVLRTIVTNRIHVLVKKADGLQWEEIVQRYRANHPKSGDHALLNQVKQKVAALLPSQKSKKKKKMQPALHGTNPSPAQGERAAVGKTPINNLGVGPPPSQKSNNLQPVLPGANHSQFQGAAASVSSKKSKKDRKLQPVLPGKIPSHVKGDKKLHMQQKRQHLNELEEMPQYQLSNENLQEALKQEVDIITAMVTQEFNNPSTPLLKSIFEMGDVEGCIYEFNKFLCHHISKRLTNSDLKLARVFGRPKPPRRTELEEYLKKHGCLSLKKSVKAPTFIASFKSYEKIDELCKTPIELPSGIIVTFKPMHFTVPKPKNIMKNSKNIRKRYVNSLIEHSNVNMLDKNWQQQDAEEKEAQAKKNQMQAEEKVSQAAEKVSQAEEKQIQAGEKQIQSEEKQDQVEGNIPVDSDDVIYVGNSDRNLTVDITDDDDASDKKPEDIQVKASSSNEEFLHGDFEVIDEVHGSDCDGLANEISKDETMEYDAVADDWDETGDDWGGSNRSHSENADGVNGGEGGQVQDNVGNVDDEDEGDEDGDVTGVDFNVDDIHIGDLDEDDLEDY